MSNAPTLASSFARVGAALAISRRGRLFTRSPPSQFRGLFARPLEARILPATARAAVSHHRTRSRAVTQTMLPRAERRRHDAPSRRRAEIAKPTSPWLSRKKLMKNENILYRNSLGGLFWPRHLRNVGGGFGRRRTDASATLCLCERTAKSGCIADGNIANVAPGIRDRQHDGSDWCACEVHRR
jgi:hypothetical protein